jgi:hypothetical protein
MMVLGDGGRYDVRRLWMKVWIGVELGVDDDVIARRYPGPKMFRRAARGMAEGRMSSRRE